LCIACFRLAVRFYFERKGAAESLGNKRGFLPAIFKKRKAKLKKLIIIGAGDCGEKIYREIRDNSRIGYEVVGFLDDNPVKHGRKIHGIPVLGPTRELQLIAKSAMANEVLIAIPSATADQMRAIVDYCKESGLGFKTIPGFGELINGNVTVNAIREVAFQDLLRREIVHLDEQGIGSYIEGKTILVTGAGGSIGSELCRQICRFNPDKIVLFERAESPLYEIEIELKRDFGHVSIIPVLSDIQDPPAINRIFNTYHPKIVFHAAAYKHVPMLELYPWKAVENNICGTMNVIEAAGKFNVERFVFVSTDKAVRPVNVMGSSKRIAEMVVQDRGGRKELKTRFMIVRFGNVVGSVGSVVPLFKKQIERGGPVTVTHPDVTRYFMLIPEACQLILQAGALGEESGGVEIYILDMGTPIRIDDMARDLIRFSGFIPDEEIKIEYIGLRPGEKLFEELITDGEGIVPTSHNKIMVLENRNPSRADLQENIDELIHFAKEQDHDKIKKKIHEIVPEYRPFDGL
jgi:FlaA1/EpsC-like NDP-sugar epimerase